MIQVRYFIDNMEWFSCKHILQELNQEVERLSKEAMELDVGAYILQELYEN